METSRPQETTEEPSLDELLRLFGYPSAVGGELFEEGVEAWVLSGDIGA